MAIKPYEENGKKIFEVYVNGFDSLGRRVQKRKKSIDTLRKAQTIEFEFKRELAQLKAEAVPYRWHEWLSKCIGQMKLTLRPSSVINYNRLNKWITPHWKSQELSKITKSDVYDVIFEKCKDIETAYTRRAILKMTQRIFQMAVEDGVLDRNPCTGVSVKVPEVDQKVFTTVEAETFLREAKITNHRFYPVWAFALLTGMRSGEMFALKWTDLDLDGRTISVSKQWTSKSGFGPTKTQKSRIVPISDDLLTFLRELRAKSPLEGEFVLPRLSEWEYGDQAKVTREFCEAIGITPIKFHDLRATFITNLLTRGETLARVMAIVGHSQLKTTNMYLRKAGVDVLGGTEKLGYKLPNANDGARILSIVK